MSSKEIHAEGRKENKWEKNISLTTMIQNNVNSFPQTNSHTQKHERAHICKFEQFFTLLGAKRR